MEQALLIAGSGGQGVLLLGRVIATTAMLSGKNVTWFPSYGAEMRGGTANCTVVISDYPIGSPIISRPDILVVMNCPSLKRFLNKLKEGGVLFYDASLVDLKVCGIDESELSKNYTLMAVRASEKASKIGSVKYANMVLFGALLKTTGIASLDTIASALKMTLPERHHSKIPENLKAIEEGYNGVY
jgi:2-oxoglutarate ferredoxin oxidoreductase subunit gamma